MHNRTGKTTLLLQARDWACLEAICRSVSLGSPMLAWGGPTELGFENLHDPEVF